MARDKAETVIHVGLAPDVMERLDDEARRQSVSRSEITRRILESYFVQNHGETGDETFAAILAPVQADSDRADVTEAELDDLIEAEREAVYREGLGASGVQ